MVKFRCAMVKMKKNTVVRILEKREREQVCIFPMPKEKRIDFRGNNHSNRWLITRRADSLAQLHRSLNSRAEPLSA